LPVGLTAPVIATRQGAHQTTPKSWPLSRTRARFFTVPRSRYHSLVPGFFPCASEGRSKLFR
jgi:hypothetical protein